MNQWVQETNIRGPTGIQGPPGPGMVFKGQVPTHADLPAGASPGDAYTVLADGHMYVWDGTAWVDGGVVVGPPGPPGADSTVPGPKGDPGPGVAAGGAAGQVLSKVDATSYNTQWTTPVSDWSNLTGKPATFPPTLPIPSSGVTGLDAAQTAQDSAIALKAPLASPALTGAPTAPTAGAGTSTTQIATTAFVATALAATGASVGTSAPPTAIGKLWWNTTRKELNIWDGTAWQVVVGTWA